MDCEFCNKSFVNKAVLKTHQRTTKYCLAIQKSTKETSFVCEFCEKTYTTQYNLSQHLNRCKKKDGKLLKEQLDEKDTYYQEKLTEMKLQNDELKRKVEKLENIIFENASQNKGSNNINGNNNKTKNKTIQNNTTNNIVINNTLDLSPENIEKLIEKHLTPNIVGQGQIGLAIMTCENLLVDENGNRNYICTDPSRQMFEFVNSDGDVVKDVKAVKLIKAIAQSKNLNQKTKESAEKLWTDEDGNVVNDRFHAFVLKSSEIVNIENDNSKFRSVLTCKTTE